MGFENPENWYLIYPHKIGENGAVLTARLSDALGPKNLTGYTVTLNVQKNGEPIVDNADCEGTSAGVVTCTIDDAFDTITAEGDYKAEFKLVKGPETLYFPKSIDGKRTYFTIQAQKALDYVAPAAKETAGTNRPSDDTPLELNLVS